MTTYSTIIFDMDGVISDTQKLHSAVESSLLSSRGVKILPDEITANYSGVRTSDFFSRLLQNQSVDIQQLIAEKWKKMQKLAEQSVDPVEGSVELISHLSRKGYKLGVASASNLNYINTVLNTLLVAKHFQAVTSSDEVDQGKPEPDVFLLAAKRLNTQPKQCVVIEDGISGMVAANKAGMYSIGLVPKIDPKRYPAKKLVLSLAELNDFF